MSPRHSNQKMGRMVARGAPKAEHVWRRPSIVASRRDIYDAGYDIVRVEDGVLEKRTVGR